MFSKLSQWLQDQGVAISSEEKKILKQYTRHTLIPKNTIIMPQGKPVKHLYFLNDGIVRLFRTHNGTDTTIAFISENTFVSTVVYLLNPVPSPCALETLTDIDAFYWEKEDVLALKELTKAGNEIELKLLNLLLQWNQDREVGIITLTPEERYVELMNTQPAVIQEVPLKYIASYLGIHQDSLSRIRKKISRKG